jgi:autotransporter-associated beta strand protein
VNTIGGSGDFLFKGSLLNTGSVLRGLNKSGTGTVTLEAANTYNGDTTIEGGTLIVNGSLQSPLTTVSRGATLGGSGSLQGVLLDRGTISAGNSAGLLSMNSLNASNGNFVFELGAPTSRGITYDAIDVANLLTLGTDTNFTFEVLDNYSFQMNDSYDLFNFSSIEASTFDVNTLLAALPNLDTANSNLKWDANSFITDGIVNVIPEPSTFSLMFGGLTGLIVLRIMRRRNG